MHELAIIGAGQLGSRHLQALAALDTSHHIVIVEPSDECVERARSRWNEVASGASPTVTWVREIAELPPQIAVAVVATGADVRRSVVEQLLDRTRVQHLVLEKVLFQRVSDYAAMGERIAGATQTAWVNCPRRMWSFYGALRQQLRGELHMAVAGSQWGLGSNAVHFLDLFAFLGGGDDLALDALRVTKVASRRPGFTELVGSVAGNSPNGSVSIASLATGELPIVVEIASPELRAVVREGEGKAWLASAADGWKWREDPVEIVPQSRLTGRIAGDLIATGRCGLTPLASSVRHHLAFLEPLAKTLGEDRCPIT